MRDASKDTLIFFVENIIDADVQTQTLNKVRPIGGVEVEHDIAVPLVLDGEAARSVCDALFKVRGMLHARAKPVVPFRNLYAQVQCETVGG